MLSPRLGVRLLGWLACVAACCSASEARAEAPLYQLELSPTVFHAIRFSEDNGSKISYDNAIAPGLLIRISLAPWLRLSGRYGRAQHGISPPPGSLEITSGNTFKPLDEVSITSISGFLHPTLNITKSLHLLGTVGIGWSSVVTPQIKIDPPDGTTLRLRTGVFLEVPFGGAIVWDVIPKWVTLSYEVLYAPAFGASGDVFSRDPYINKAGVPAVVGAFPRFNGSLYQMLNVSLSL